MLDNRVNVQWLDVNRNISRHDSINKLFQSYIEKSKSETDNSGRLFDVVTLDESDGVKIKDWYGWTSVLKIIHYNYYEGRLCHIKSNKDSIFINEYGLFPIYDPSRSIIGFHGEIKFPYEVKHVKDLKNGDTTRVSKHKDENNNLEEFPKIEIEYISPDTTDVYWIITKSGFFNANNFHLVCKEINNSKENFK